MLLELSKRDPLKGDDEEKFLSEGDPFDQPKFKINEEKARKLWAIQYDSRNNSRPFNAISRTLLGTSEYFKSGKNYLQRKAVENRSLKAIMEEKLKKQVIATQGPRHKSSILSLQERIGNACRT